MDALQTKPAKYNGLHPGGRPSYTLNDEQRDLIAKWASKGLSMSLIADALGCAKTALMDNEEFATIHKKHYAQAGIRVAHRQFELLESRNEAVAGIQAIWLGKQYLGQSDKVESLSEVHQVSTMRFVLPDGQAFTPAMLRAQEQEQVVDGQVRELPPAQEAPEDYQAEDYPEVSTA